jgi:hypothetical protein
MTCSAVADTRTTWHESLLNAALATADAQVVSDLLSEVIPVAR